MSTASAHAPGAPGDGRGPAGTAPPTRRRSGSSLVTVLLAVVVAVLGTVFVTPATPAQATLDYPLNGTWNGWPWSRVTFNNSVGHTADTCNGASTSTQRFRNIVKVGPNSYRGEMAHVAYGGCPIRVDGWAAATFTIDSQGTRLAVASNGGTMWFNRSAVPHVPECRSGKVVEEKFDIDGFSPVHAYTVQFSSLNYCYDGINVWFKGDPHPPVVWRTSGVSRYVNGNCVGGLDKTANEVKQPTIRVTCNAVFSNVYSGDFNFKAQRDINGTSRWTLPGNFNGALTFTVGPVSGTWATNPTVQATRRYTLLITADNTYTFSGIGNEGKSPMP